MEIKFFIFSTSIGLVHSVIHAALRYDNYIHPIRILDQQFSAPPQRGSLVLSIYAITLELEFSIGPTLPK
ncbi:hypothetical protein [Bartonella bacilliformis]|uniref:hypothetical protein n=1 Tax=Bartonella bacilliformis TaxID=774 RepID=UPI0005A46BC2|nr:hypothetical protein [Bartonella bacilliformis]